MKVGVLLRGVFLGSMVLVAACGSGSSQFAPKQDGGSSSRDATTSQDAVTFGDTGTGGNHKNQCNPLTCKKLGYSCGPAGDGCGSKLDCGTCSGTETCGGGGEFSVCGGTAGCVKKTCQDLGINCGPAGDGCGGPLNCGTCSGLDTCGGGGTPSVCGTSVQTVEGGIEGGGLCIPKTCADQNIGCGPAGDGCGNPLNCYPDGGTSCPSGQTCGGAGTPNTCGTPPKNACVPKTCKDLGFTCGPVGDGCGGLALDSMGNPNCGTCMSPEFCGGGGKPSVCGSDFVPPDGGLEGGACVPQTCQSLGLTCGPAGDGCGNLLNCYANDAGACPVAGQTCGGGGTHGQCGAPPACVPKTCQELGITCGPSGDGCGNLLNCYPDAGTSCPAGQTCGGGGKPGACGTTFVPPDGGLEGGACVPKTCANAGVNGAPVSCGPAGDGCGNTLNCYANDAGACPIAGETCGGGGTPGVCGSSTLPCTPLTCAGQGISCGPAGDGCGHTLNCYPDGGTSCPGIETCGGSGTPGKCGAAYTLPDGGVVTLPEGGFDGGFCVPETCASQGIACGQTGDGCGNTLNCYPGGGTSCPTAGQTCGGAGVSGQCGTPPPVCVPATCATLNLNCGPASDGCGGLALDSMGNPNCGACMSPDICGGGGMSNVCGDVLPCTNLCTYQTACGGAGTTITGTVVAGTLPAYLPATAPNGPDPVPNVFVYVPNTTPSAFTPGVQCSACGADVTGAPLVGAQATTNAQGQFTLTNVPVPPSGVVPIVIQLGRWRRIFGLTNTNNPGVNVTCAGPNTVTLRMPRSQAEGDIPFTAISTGKVDPMECVLRKMGVADTEFTAPGGGGRIEMYQGNGSLASAAAPVAVTVTNGSPTVTFTTAQTLAPGGVLVFSAQAGHVYTIQSGTGTTYTLTGNYNGATSAAGTATYSDPIPETNLVPDAVGGVATLDQYDEVLFPCWGEDPRGATTEAGNNKTANQQNNVITYTGNGGRVFATHYSYSWLYDDTPFEQTVNSWVNDVQYATATATIVQPSTFADVNTFYSWMTNLTWSNATNPAGTFAVASPRNDFTTPVSVADNAELWANASSTTGSGTHNYPLVYTFPYGNTPSMQCGKVVYSDFHVSIINNGSCNGNTNDQDDSCEPFPTECTTTPMTAQEKALEYLIWDLSSCPAPAPGPTCTPKTCAELGYDCGQTGDGCADGVVLNCYPDGGTSCPIACQTCGGGGTPNVCGGTCACVPKTCVELGVACGQASNGCGGIAVSSTGDPTSCGSCPSGQTCGGGGVDGQCGVIDASACTPKTCAELGITCGPAGDGCGHLLNCYPDGGSSCPGCQTCGGGGVAGQCGGTCCVPKTCVELGVMCGPAGDGCGGLAVSSTGNPTTCGTCPAGQTCGGGGVDGQCGAIDSGTCTPLTCGELGYNCGPAGDGCGHLLNCYPDGGSSCSGECQTCGGGGTPGVCGGTCCVPKTCAELGVMCGPAGDGCGGLAVSSTGDPTSCGSCPTGETCGGGGVSGQCGAIDGGTCVRQTCESQGFNCGPAGDGCGGSLNCGTCSDAGCQTCGGGGTPGVCGGACCMPETCQSQGFNCGPAGNGCGGSLDCGGCPEGEVCGGGGTAGVCGAPDSAACVPLTCQAQGIDCGPAGNGCGGSLSCGPCPAGQTCGGGGKPGKCGGPTCTPKTCKELNFNCGPAGDGCGGSLNCGTCVAPDTCGGGSPGTPGVCGAPTGPK